MRTKCNRKPQQTDSVFPEVISKTLKSLTSFVFNPVTTHLLYVIAVNFKHFMEINYNRFMDSFNFVLVPLVKVLQKLISRILFIIYLFKCYKLQNFFGILKASGLLVLILINKLLSIKYWGLFK